MDEFAVLEALALVYEHWMGEMRCLASEIYQDAMSCVDCFRQCLIAWDGVLLHSVVGRDLHFYSCT